MKAMRWLGFLAAWAAGVAAAELPSFDFTRAEDRAGWAPLHDIRSLTPSNEGWVAVLGGEDPYLAGPPREYPADMPLWMHLRLRSDATGPAQVFYFDGSPSEEQSVRFHVRGGAWQEVRLPLPPLGKRTRLRLDPPGASGSCVVAFVRFEARPPLAEPPWPQPSIAPWTPVATVRSGDLELLHGPGIGQLEVRIAGTPMAIGHDRAQVGHLSQGRVQWTELSGRASVRRAGTGIRVTSNVDDPEGGRWELEQVLRPVAMGQGIEFESRLTTTRDRQVVHAPLLILLPGAGPHGFGKPKTQGLLAGVEYLEDEPSSSEADVIGPGARRRVPDSLKLTFPLAAISARERCLGLAWEPHPDIAVVHDSPDRVFRAGGHLMGLIFPGAHPDVREDGSLLPHGPVAMRAGQAVVARGRILGSRGSTVLPAIQAAVAARPLPALPRLPGMDLASYAQRVAQGWLRSEIRDGARFRHAVGPGFGSSPAADAALGLKWASGVLKDPALAAEAKSVAREAESAVPKHRLHASLVGHLRQPSQAPLVFGGLRENVEDAVREGRAIVASLDAGDGLRYRPPKGGVDLGRTHASREANGLAAGAIAHLLELAAFTGDRGLRDHGLRLLHGLSAYRATVPRGAQTWEVPLHTPDLLASAHLTRAWTLGHELTGDHACLEEARSWAWTGVPFIYLASPTTGPVGVYGTIPVLGATQFIAPLWIGLPVQWCGLAYGNAVRRLARHDPRGPWSSLADGIALAAIQHTLSSEAPRHVGLLPDSFDVRAQAPNPVPINPATLFPEALRALGGPWIHDLRRMRATGWIVQAPGEIRVERDAQRGVRIRVQAWSDDPWWMTVDGLEARPRVHVDGREAKPGEIDGWEEGTGRLVLRLRGRPRVEVLR